MADGTGSRPASGPHLLVFEPDGRGHAGEWIGHLLDWAARDTRQARITVVTDAALQQELAARARAHGETHVRVERMTPAETKLCNSRRLAVSGFARWWTMRRYLRTTGAGHGLFLGIDHLSLPLGLGLSADGTPLSGILFRPSIHYGDEDRAAWKEGLRDARKRLLYRGMLRNPAVRTVWSLDPDFPAFAVARFEGGEKVRPVPDPVHPMPGGEAGLPMPAYVAAAAGRTAFLLFGVLAERKGTLKLIDALSRIEAGYARSMHVVLAGSVDPAIRGRLDQAIDALRESRPELSLRLDDRRLTSDELAAYVVAADVVLAPYQRFVGSSGVLLWAANAGKPVITQSQGLIGRTVADFGLGMAVDTTDASDLAGALVAAVRRGSSTLADPHGIARFVESHSPDVFAARIMESVFGFSVDDAHAVNTAHGSGEPAYSTD